MPYIFMAKKISVSGTRKSSADSRRVGVRKKSPPVVSAAPAPVFHGTSMPPHLLMPGNVAGKIVLPS